MLNVCACVFFFLLNLVKQFIICYLQQMCVYHGRKFWYTNMKVQSHTCIPTYKYSESCLVSFLKENGFCLRCLFLKTKTGRWAANAKINTMMCTRTSGDVGRKAKKRNPDDHCLTKFSAKSFSLIRCEVFYWTETETYLQSVTIAKFLKTP